MTLPKLSEKRKTERFSRTENVIVKAKIANDDFWKEKAILKSVSRLGAGFDIKKSCKIGQLVSLLLALPVNLRVYDHEKELYRVWGLVQSSHKLTNEDFEGFHVGVAFIGKDAPESFYENYDQSYRILGINDDGLWRIIETDREFINRRHPRFWVSIRGMLVSGNDENGENLEFTAVTENISKSGASIFSETSFVVGDYVKFSLPEFDFKSEAVVRNRSGLGNTTPKIHLEFLENEFPIEKLELQIE
ncbi:MAG: PilZ domain-containing protein [Pyrinomonadaceae bacterium]